MAAGVSVVGVGEGETESGMVEEGEGVSGVIEEGEGEWGRAGHDATERAAKRTTKICTSMAKKKES